MFTEQRIYNATHPLPPSAGPGQRELYRKQLFKAVVIHRAVMLLDRDVLSDLLLLLPGGDFEESTNRICREVAAPLSAVLLEEAHAHSCGPGADCQEFFMVDADAKIHRAMCAAPVSRASAA